MRTHPFECALDAHPLRINLLNYCEFHSAKGNRCLSSRTHLFVTCSTTVELFRPLTFTHAYNEPFSRTSLFIDSCFNQEAETVTNAQRSSEKVSQGAQIGTFSYPGSLDHIPIGFRPSNCSRIAVPGE